MSLKTLDVKETEAEKAEKTDNSEVTQLIATTSTANEIQTKEMDSQPECVEVDPTKTDPMIRNEEAPNGTISSAPSLSLSETEATPDGFCSRRPIDMEKRQIWKNLIVVSVVFLLTFIAYGGLGVLQSSLHVQKGMGVINQAVAYASMALSCLLLPKIAIRLLGHKWCMSLSLSGYLLWMASNGFGVWATMLPASIILGICAATLWTAQASYLTILARNYAVKTKQETAPVTSLFFGTFTAIYASFIASVIFFTSHD